MPGIPPYEFRVFSRLRGRRSWAKGSQRFASPLPAAASVAVLDVPVFRHRLMIMAALAKGLPVLFVPEQLRIAAVWFDVVDDRRRNKASFCFAADAPGMTFQIELPGLLPLLTVATYLCTGPLALALTFVFVTIFSSIGYQPGAARIFTGCLRSSWHLHHLRHQKRTDGISPRSFILFLVILSYHTDRTVNKRNLLQLRAIRLINFCQVKVCQGISVDLVHTARLQLHFLCNLRPVFKSQVS